MNKLEKVTLLTFIVSLWALLLLAIFPEDAFGWWEGPLLVAVGSLSGSTFVIAGK